MNKNKSSHAAVFTPQSEKTMEPPNPAQGLPADCEVMPSDHTNRKPRVAFICVHNSCRSQMAEALSQLLAGDVFTAYSAGTEVKPQINQTAVKIIRNHYGLDMNQSQYSKLIDELPEIDIVVTMGCNVICPYLPSRHQEDWGLDDPTGKPDEVFLDTARLIASRVKDLARRIQSGEI